jgi:hypothetical protein
MSKINVYVNSRKRKTDETASNFNVIVPDGLLKVNKDQYFTLSVNSFYCYNDFYQCNSNSNYFILMFRTNTNNIYMTLPIGCNIYFPTGFGNTGIGAHYHVGISNFIKNPDKGLEDWNGGRFQAISFEITVLFGKLND